VRRENIRTTKYGDEYSTRVRMLRPFRAFSREHDGLIVIGNIPEEAVQAAARLSGLRNANLVEKPFVAELSARAA
jgi:hypothetical protein